MNKALRFAVALLIVASATAVPAAAEPQPPIVSEVDDGRRNVTSASWAEHDQAEKANAADEAKDFGPGVEKREQPAIDQYLNELRKWIGYREKPVNRTIFNDAYAKDQGSVFKSAPWCSIFLSVTARWAGISRSILPQTAAVVADKAWFVKRSRYDATPHKGDWIFFGSPLTHIEAVESTDAKTVTTIGGNTTNGKGSPEGVWRKRLLKTNPRIAGYGHVAWLDAGNGKPSSPPRDESGGSLPRTGFTADLAKIAILTTGIGAILVFLAITVREAYRGVHRRRARHRRKPR